jgi:hypothetical protein
MIISGIERAAIYAANHPGRCGSFLFAGREYTVMYRNGTCTLRNCDTGWSAEQRCACNEDEIYKFASKYFWT